MTGAEAAEFYKEEMLNEMKSDFKGEVLEVSREHYINGNEITVSVTLKCREDIAEKRVIETGE